MIPVTQTLVTSSVVAATDDGEEIRGWTLQSPAHRVSVTILEWGATVQAVRAPDREGVVDDVAVGFADARAYLTPAYRSANPYFGSTIGRFANRIASSRFDLDGTTYSLSRNDGANSLHGGLHGFDQFVWNGTELPDGVRMSRLSPDGEGGFPGALDVSVEFRLTGSMLQAEYHATTDRRTVVNLTNHTYWNLAGTASTSAVDHVVQVDADSYLPVDDRLIPLGTVEPVRDSPFDFRRPRDVASALDQDHLQLVRAGGIDHTFVIRPAGRRLRDAVHVHDPVSGRSLTIATTEPGVQFYSGNFLDGTFSGHGGVVYSRRSALAFEPQHFPDSPNRPGFPSTALSPGRLFRSTTQYRLGVTD